jgi:hypothetical protein
MVLILKLWLIALEPLLPILMFLKEIGTCIMNLLKTLAWKMKLLLMIVMNDGVVMNSARELVSV